MKHYWFQPFLIPFTLLSYIASIVLIIIHKPVKYEFKNGCLEMISDNEAAEIVGSSWGNRMIWYAHENYRHGGTSVHERVHTAHGEWVNAVAHLILVPLSLLLGGDWWLLGAILLSQAAFGITYGSHFMIEWARGGFNANWVPAYTRIYTERIAYRKEVEFIKGQCPDAWGA